MFKKDFLKLIDFEKEDIKYLLELAKDFKDKKKNNISHRYLEGKNIVLLFEKTSTRTRCSFEIAAYDLGMGVTYLDPNSSQMKIKESIEDTARVLASIYDGIEYRGYEQEIVETLAKYSKVPVWNGLTTEFHPTQMIADLLTIKEQFHKLKGLKLTFMGDCRNNVSNSLLIACAIMGINYCGLGPKELKPDEKLIEIANKYAKKTGATINFTENLEKGLKDTDIIYTDVWVSMGEKEEIWEKRIEKLRKYQVNSYAMSLAKENAIFLHCLPAFHNLKTKTAQIIFEKFGLTEMEVTNEIFESEKSKVFIQAENRMHTIKAIIYATMKDVR